MTRAEKVVRIFTEIGQSVNNLKVIALMTDDETDELYNEIFNIK